MRAATVAELELLKTWGSATIHEALGARGAMDVGIKPVDPNRRLAWHAFTVDCTPADNLLLHYALTRISAGQVLVAGAKGAIDTGPWGIS